MPAMQVILRNEAVKGSRSWIVNTIAPSYITPIDPTISPCQYRQALAFTPLPSIWLLLISFSIPFLFFKRSFATSRPHVKMTTVLSPINTDATSTSQEFPAYDEQSFFSTEGNMATISSLTPRSPPELVEQVIRTPGRQPSPQPTHFNIANRNGNGNGHRVLRSATVGYVAPEFKGRTEQMSKGKSSLALVTVQI